MYRKTGNDGFTLIELAMVLFIVALILGGVLTPLSTRLEQANRKQAQEVLKEIKESLIGYALVNGHLPCPDCPLAANANCIAAVSDDGVEDGMTLGGAVASRVSSDFNTCTIQVGHVPWVTLGVPEFDPWGRHYVYSVTQTVAGGFADDNDGTNNALCSSKAGISFQLCSTGDMTIMNWDVTNNIRGNIVAQNIPILIFSYGTDGQPFGGTAPAAASELDNWWTDSLPPTQDRTFISNDYVANQFDDLVQWITTPELMYRMVTAERLP